MLFRASFDDLQDKKSVVNFVVNCIDPYSEKESYSTLDLSHEHSSRQYQSRTAMSSREIKSTGRQPASSSYTSDAPQLISFDKSNATSYQLPTALISSNKYYSNNVLHHEMAKDCTSAGVFNFSFSAHQLAGDDDGDYNNQNQDDGRAAFTATRTPEQAQEHLMAERKRRDNLNQLFIALSKIVPGLKKLDKASLLGDAINYLKSLQERVSVLEEQAAESTIKLKNSSIDIAISTEDDLSSSIDIRSGGTSQYSSPPEIKARILNNHMLIKICCQKQKGLMSRIPNEMEKVHLSVVDMRIIPFGEVALDITILAEMRSEFRGSVKDIVDHLRGAGFLEPADA